jgi:hypothetical protein
MALYFSLLLPELGLALCLRLLLLAWGVHFYDLYGQVTLAGGKHGYSPVGAQTAARGPESGHRATRKQILAIRFTK